MSNTYRRTRATQREAIRLLAQGATDQEVADAIGCHRVTVTNWRNHDPVFIAAYNRFLDELDSAFHEKVRALDRHALSTVEENLDDPSIALAYLRVTKATQRTVQRRLTDPGDVRSALDVTPFLKDARMRARGAGGSDGGATDGAATASRGRRAIQGRR
jgi:DNA invertase Pin-like site-specific DNA recombinase